MMRIYPPVSFDSAKKVFNPISLFSNFLLICDFDFPVSFGRDHLSNFLLIKNLSY